MSNYIKNANETSKDLNSRQHKRCCMICGRKKVLIDYKESSICMSCLSNRKGEM